MRGTTAISSTLAVGLAAFAAAGGASYLAQAGEPSGPRSLGEWAERSVRPPGALPEGRGPALVARYRCLSCHSIGGRGAAAGPALDGVRDRKTRAEIVRWIDDPQALKPGTIMPTFGFPPIEEQLLADYLLSLPGGPEGPER